MRMRINQQYDLLQIFYPLLSGSRFRINPESNHYGRYNAKAY